VHSHRNPRLSGTMQLIQFCGSPSAVVYVRTGSCAASPAIEKDCSQASAIPSLRASRIGNSIPRRTAYINSAN
jgi:hypothetical protein